MYSILTKLNKDDPKSVSEDPFTSIPNIRFYFVKIKFNL